MLKYVLVKLVLIFLEFYIPNIIIEAQGFIHAILISGRWHKKPNVLIEVVSNSIFLIFFIKHVVIEMTFKIN